MTREDLIQALVAENNGKKDDLIIAIEKAMNYGYNVAIDKACEWIELNVCNAYNFRGDDISIGFVEQFRKAMESGCSEIPNNCEKGGEE